MYEIICLLFPASISILIYGYITKIKYSLFERISLWAIFSLIINLAILFIATAISENPYAPFVFTPPSRLFLLKFLSLAILLAVLLPFVTNYVLQNHIVSNYEILVKRVYSRRGYYMLFLAQLLGILIFLAWVYLSLTMTLIGDDASYFSKMQINIDFLKSRYFTWSSRWCVEALLVFLSKNFILFKLINIFLLCSFPFVFGLLFTSMKYKIWSFVLLVSLYNIAEMNSAGWAATMCNYYYVAYAGVLAIYLQIRENLNIFLWLLLLVLLVFCCSQEQCAVIMLVVSAGIFWKMKHKSALFSCAIAAISLLAFLGAPGNYNRLAREITTWLPEFSQYSFFYKAYLGYISTICYYIFQKNIIMVFFIGILVFCRVRNLFFALLAMCVFLTLQYLGQEYFGGYFGKQYLADMNFNFLKYSALAFIISIIFVCFVLTSIYKMKIDIQHKLILISLLMLGFFVRAILGFSPTIWASSLRTFCFTNFLLFTFICYISLITKIKEKDFLFLLIPCVVVQLDVLYHGLIV